MIKQDVLFDQHFISDKTILKKIVGCANLKKKDIVLEIGAGTGNLTKLLVKKAKVIAIEKDLRFKGDLDKIKEVKVIYDNILDVNIPMFNKIVANIPYALSEPLINMFMNLNFEIAVLTISKRFFETLRKDSKLSLIIPYYFEIKKNFEVSREAFSPMPAMDSVVISLIPIKKDFLNEKNYLIRDLYDQNDKKTKNALRNSLMNYYKLYKKKVSRYDIVQKIKKLGLNDVLLNKLLYSLSYHEFKVLLDKLKSVDFTL